MDIFGVRIFVPRNKEKSRIAVIQDKKNKMPGFKWTDRSKAYNSYPINRSKYIK